MWMDFCCLEYLFWLLLSIVKVEQKLSCPFLDQLFVLFCFILFRLVLFCFKLWIRARETESIKNRALKLRFGLLDGKGLFYNSTTFIQHSQTAINDAAEHLHGVNSWDSLAEEYKNGGMAHGEPFADHIKICSTSFELWDDNWIHISLKVKSAALHFLRYCDPSVLCFYFSHYLISCISNVSIKSNHTSFLSFLSLLLVHFLPTFLFFTLFCFLIHSCNFGLNLPLSGFDADFFNI